MGFPWSEGIQCPWSRQLWYLWKRKSGPPKVHEFIVLVGWTEETILCLNMVLKTMSLSVVTCKVIQVKTWGDTWGLYAHSHSAAELFMGGCIVFLPLACAMHCFRLRRHLPIRNLQWRKQHCLETMTPRVCLKLLRFAAKIKLPPKSSIACSFNCCNICNSVSNILCT